MSFVIGLQCRECGRDYPQSPSYLCEACLGPLEIRYDFTAIKKSISHDAVARRERNL